MGAIGNALLDGVAMLNEGERRVCLIDNFDSPPTLQVIHFLAPHRLLQVIPNKPPPISRMWIVYKRKNR